MNTQSFGLFAPFSGACSSPTPPPGGGQGKQKKRDMVIAHYIPFLHPECPIVLTEAKTAAPMGAAECFVFVLCVTAYASGEASGNKLLAIKSSRTSSVMRYHFCVALWPSHCRNAGAFAVQYQSSSMKKQRNSTPTLG